MKCTIFGLFILVGNKHQIHSLALTHSLHTTHFYLFNFFSPLISLLFCFHSIAFCFAKHNIRIQFTVCFSIDSHMVFFIECCCTANKKRSSSCSVKTRERTVYNSPTRNEMNENICFFSVDLI